MPHSTRISGNRFWPSRIPAKTEACRNSDAQLAFAAMTKIRFLVLAILVLVAACGTWLWFGKPAEVDMAAYAPADSLLYLEANKPIEVADAIAGTEAWKSIGTLIGPLASTPRRSWLRELVDRTGVGPIQSVVLSRAQVAVVLTDLRTIEEGDTLNIKPEGVLLIETHSASSRLRPAFEESLKTLAENTYTQPTLKRTTVDGIEFSEWTGQDGSRRIVGTVAGSLVLVGTSEAAVRKCLATSKGASPSLKDDAEMRRLRTELQSSGGLTFGFVPATSSAKLLAIGLPALVGRAPGDSQFQRLVAGGAGKIFGSLAWSSRPYQTGIEDRYFITLQPPVGSRLKDPFQSAPPTNELQAVVPGDVYSVSSYNFANPVEAWRALNGTVSAQVDALATIVFSSLLKSSLISYGIADPESFLATVDHTLLTIKLDEIDERSLLVARVRDHAALRSLIQKNMAAQPSVSREGNEVFEDSEGELAAQLTGELIVLGSPEDVRQYAERRGPDSEELKRLTFFRSSGSEPTIVTYTSDADRVRAFINSILSAKKITAVPTGQSEKAIASLPYSVTETTLSEQRIERVTRSPLGQFSSLFPLLIPAPPTQSKAPAK